MRVARLLGWTYQEAVTQPLPYLYLLAADFGLEAEEAEARRGGGSPPPTGGSGRTTQETIEYRLKPKKE